MTVCVSSIWFFVTPWTVAHQGPLSVELSRQEYQNGLPFPSPGDLPNLGIKPMSLASLAQAGGFFTTVSSATWDGQKEFLLTNKRLDSPAAA